MISWNIYLLIFYKRYFPLTVEDGGDNKWGVGQTTPLVLLVLPAMTIVEEYFGEYRYFFITHHAMVVLLGW